MRVIFLNRCYWPDSEATGQLLADLAEHLAQSMDIHVVCGQPNHPKVDGFVRVGTQVHQGVTIHRLAHTTFNKRMPAGRLINLLSFTRAAKRYLRKTQLPADVVVSETDPFLLPPVGVAHAKAIGARSVCYLQDIYPDVAEAVGKAKPGRLTRSIRGRLRDAYATTDQVVVLGSCMRDRLTSEPWGIDPGGIDLIPNWADCETIRPVAPEKNEFRNAIARPHQFVIMHSGNMGLTQDLGDLIQAAAMDAWPADAVLRIIGGGANRDHLISKWDALSTGNLSTGNLSTGNLSTGNLSTGNLGTGNLGTGNLGTGNLGEGSPNAGNAGIGGIPRDRVRFLPYQPREELSATLSAADVHVVSMNPKVRGCLCPSKLYGIMAAGRPVLAIADAETDLVRTLRKLSIGWHLEPGNPGRIAAMVATLASTATEDLEDRGRRGRQAAEQQFDRGVVTQKFETLLRGLAKT
ncbi:MAG: glycosyltransferase [Planctomycetota bacterium]